MVGEDGTVTGTTGFVSSAIGLGMAYAAVPGAVNTEALRRGVRGGFRLALSVQLGSLVGDGLWAILGVTGAAVLVRYDSVALVLGLAAAALVFALARTALVEAFGGGEVRPEATDAGRPFCIGLIFGLANPAGLAFWAGIGGGVLAYGGDGPTSGRTALFLVAFLIGAASCGIGMAASVGWGRRYVGGRFFRWVNVIRGLALGYYAVRVSWSTLQRYGRWVPWVGRGLA